MHEPERFASHDALSSSTSGGPRAKHAGRGVFRRRNATLAALTLLIGSVGIGAYAALPTSSTVNSQAPGPSEAASSSSAASPSGLVNASGSVGASGLVSASAAPTGVPSPPQKSATPGTSAAPTAGTLVFGSVVDAVDAAPADEYALPGSLPKRPETAIISVGGTYQAPKKGWIGGAYVMMHRGDNVVLKGTGYLRVRYEIAWFNRPGSMVMPTWTGLSGKLFHVASGGGHRMDDTKPGDPANYTWMGQPVISAAGPAYGYVVLPAGAQQMWQNEYFYLDGEVTLHENEGAADYNITATPVTWADVTADINTPAPAKAVRYGIVRDTGDDRAPVPQYLTRQNPTDPATVPQTSYVR